jgi:hypothetical protein
MDMHPAEPLVPEPRYIFLGSDQILAESIKAGGETICFDIHKLSATAVEGIYYSTNL